MQKTSNPWSLFFLQTICILSGVLGISGIWITHVTPQRSDAMLTTKNIVTILSVLCLISFLWLGIRLTKFFNGRSRIAKNLATSLLFGIIGAYAVVMLFVVLFQDAFIARNSIVFQPKTMSQDAAKSLVTSNVEELNVVTPEHIHLKGWLIKNSFGNPSPLLIYFGGSSQEVSNMIPYFEKLDGWSVALVNYRGYGLSEGSPSEENLFQDATLIYDTLTEREDIDRTKIAVMGWSLGTGVAVQLSEQRAVDRTILVTPFDSWAHMFQSRDFPFIPLSLIKDRYFIFNSIGRAPSIHSPLLCMVGSEDNIVHPALSEELARHWGGEDTLVVYQGASHGLLFQENSSWDDIAKFLEGIE